VLAYFGSFWDDWNLLHKVTFDGEQRLIIIAPEVTDIDVRQDIYSDWKEWLRVRDYAKFPRALRTIGGDPTEPGQRAGDQYFLMNGWRIRTWEGDHQLNVAGSIFVDPTADTGFTQLDRPTTTINVPTLLPQNIVISTVRSNLVTTIEVAAQNTGSAGLTDQDRQTIQNTETLTTAINTIVQNLPDSGSLSTMSSNIDSILGSARILSTTITSASTLEVKTNLTESDGFYDGMGVILTSGSTGVSRMVNAYFQTSGTLYFEQELPFIPLVGSQLVMITQHKTNGGNAG
jgi:hypothetical protein